MHRRSLSASQPLVLPSRPCSKGLVEMAEHLNTTGAIEPPVVVHPATHHRVDEPRQILQTLVAPAVADPSLRRMKLQTALSEPIPDGVSHHFSLPPASAVNDGIVRIALERDARVAPSHPEIKREVQEQIGQERTRDPALRRALRPRLPGSGS